MKKLFFVLIGLLAVSLIVSGCGKTAGKAVQVAPGSGLPLVCNDPKNMDKCGYTISCPDGTYAVGLTGGAGMILDSMRLVCKTQEDIGGYLEQAMMPERVGTVSAMAGGNGGGFYRTNCINQNMSIDPLTGKGFVYNNFNYLTGINTYISKFKGTYYPSQLSPICDGTVNKSIVIGWGKDGLRGPWTIVCPSGQVVTSITGQAGVTNTTGSYVYSIKSVGCKPRPVTTPAMPEPNKIPSVIKGENFIQECNQSGQTIEDCSVPSSCISTGKVTISVKSFSKTYTDYCADSKTFIHYNCEDGKLDIKKQNCDLIYGAGTVCNGNGPCK